MKALITGSNGFLGRHLFQALEKAGAEVVCATRTSQENAIAVGDIDGDTDWSSALQDVDVVAHLAGRAHVLKETAACPLAEFRKVNKEGTIRLAQQAAENRVRRFVFVSSIGVHGLLSGDRPISCRDEFHPHDAYSISKMEAELGLKELCSEVGIELVVVRPPLVYGSGVGANFLRLMKLAGSGIPLPLASVDNRRSLVYVENLCDLIFQCLENPAAAGETFLVSDDHDVSTPELLRMLAAAMGRKLRLFPMSGKLLQFAGRLTGRSAEVERLCGSLQVDISHTKKTLGWHPPFSLREGIQKTVEWFCEESI